MPPPNLSAAMAEEALRAREVTKVYRSRNGPVEALRGVSLDLHAGERVALLGRNGAGKTTLLRIASTLLLPTSGSVEVLGRDVVQTPEAVRPLIAVVPQEGKPFFHLTPREMVYAYLRARGVPREDARARTEAALERMGLVGVADRLCITLSGGQKQRAIVATVLATAAPLLFLDEPTLGMDPFARRSVWDSLRQLTRQGSSILLTTHYLEEAEALSQRLYIMDEGRMVVTGTAEELKRQLGGSLRVSVPAPAEDLKEELASFGPTAGDGEVISVFTGPERINEILALATRRGLQATVGPVTLEEAFLQVVGRSIDEE